MKTFNFAKYILILISLYSLATPRKTLWALTLFLFSLLALLMICLNYWLIPGGFAWRHHRYGQNLSKLHGPFGWPILGNLPIMGSLAHRKLATLATSLGATKLMAFSLGTARVIISSHPDTAKEILCGSSFSDRPVKQSARLLMFERAIGFAPYGSYWRHLRRIATNHMFSPKRIHDLGPLRKRLANEIMDEIKEEMDLRGVVALRRILQKGSLSNILEGVFGSHVSLRREELDLIVREGFELIEKFNVEDYFPVSFLDLYGVKRRCTKLASKVKMVVGDIVRERKCMGDGCDFLGALLSLNDEDRLSEADLVPVLWEMIFRGTDTIAILLEWAMARMVLHQDIQAKAQEELDKCVGNRPVQDSDISNLHYLQSIMKEVLRMHPPGPLLSWARLATCDVHVDKVFVPSGTTAMVNMWAITHDPFIWEDPWAFKPSRFLEVDVQIMGSDLRLAPFGSGRRVCPGKALGLATVHLWFARLLHQYKWKPAHKVDLSECLRLSLEMKRPLICHAIPRRDLKLCRSSC